MSALLLLIPLLGIIILNLPLGRVMNKLALWFGLLFCLVLMLVAANPISEFWAQPLFIAPWLSLKPVVDPLTLVMIICIGMVGFAAFMVGNKTVEDEERRFNFFNLMILAIMGMVGVVLARDMFTMYIFLEITAVASYILVAFERRTAALEGAFKYLILSAVATMLILAALALMIMAVGSLEFDKLSLAFKSGESNSLLALSAAMFLAAIMVKAGVVPFHGWLPDAYSEAPSGVSVLLAGIATKAAGVYVMMRMVISIFDASPVIQSSLMLLGAITIVVGALAALGQKDFKRMLAYSSISQVGYIVLGLGVGSPLGVAGALFHLFNHSVFKSLLFINASAVESEARTRDMDKLGGIAGKMPFTGVTSVIGFLSAAGLPPLSGFWSKLMIAVALLNAGEWGYLTIMILASVITLAYFLTMQRKVFFGKLAPGLEGLREANMWIVVPAVLLAIVTLVLGITFPWLFETLLVPVRSIL